MPDEVSQKTTALPGSGAVRRHIPVPRQGRLGQGGQRGRLPWAARYASRWCGVLGLRAVQGLVVPGSKVGVAVPRVASRCRTYIAALKIARRSEVRTGRSRSRSAVTHSADALDSACSQGLPRKENRPPPGGERQSKDADRSERHTYSHMNLRQQRQPLL